jgi:hypothetical protein
MTKKVLLSNVAKAYVLASYLRSLHEKIGTQDYIASFIRKEHGTGQGFFGIGNTGSYDCLKETLRGITDGLDLRFCTFKKIPYVSDSCLGILTRSREVHRIEHTFELSAQYLELERRYILEGQGFTPNSLGRWFIENQIVCLIEQVEQTGVYSEKAPFSKYSAPIYYRGRDVSHLSHSEIRVLNQEVFSEALSIVDQFDFTQDVERVKANLIQPQVKHRLPPLELAIPLANDEMKLLDQHYIDKVTKATTPGGRYFKQFHADRWHKWKSSQKDLS